MSTPRLLALAALLVGLGYAKRAVEERRAELADRGCRYAYERTVFTDTAAVHQIVLRCQDGTETTL